MKVKKDYRMSEPVSSGERVFLAGKNAPICLEHGKKAIICEPPDEPERMCFCIDCIATALYELPRIIFVYEKVLGRKITKEEIKKWLHYNDEEAEKLAKHL
jgi:hypothetical protein